MGQAFNEFMIDEYVRQIIKTCDDTNGNERFINVAILLQEYAEKKSRKDKSSFRERVLKKLENID